jgi:hypothetical protein
MIVVQHSEKSAMIDVSQESTKDLESAIRGENNRNTLSAMVTQSLPQSKALITANKKQANESLDSLALCVGGIEGKKQRVGFRLTIAERQSLEFAAKQNNMKLSNWLRQIAQNSAHQKSA